MNALKKKNPDLPINDKQLWFKISDCYIFHSYKIRKIPLGSTK